MSKILKEQQWQQRRAAKLQRANRPLRRGTLLLVSQPNRSQGKASKAKTRARMSRPAAIESRTAHTFNSRRRKLLQAFDPAKQRAFR